MLVLMFCSTLTNYTLDLILWALIPMVITFVVCYVFLFDLFVGLAFFALGTIDLHLRINKANEKLMLFANRSDSDIIGLQLEVERFINEHHRLCCRVNKFARIWKDAYLAGILAECPTTLVILHLVLFETMDYYMTIMYIIALIDAYVILFVLQYFFASLSHKMHKQCKLLARIQWLFNRNNSNLRIKLKIQTYFERLSSKKRIGFSIGTLVVITFPLFAGVSDHSIVYSL